MNLLNNSRINVDKYLLQFHVMKLNDLCPCFKLHQPIQVNPIRNYPRLNVYEDPEPEEAPEVEPKPEDPPRNQEPEALPQNSHPPLNIVNHEAQNIEVTPHNDNQVNAQAMEPPYEEVNLEREREQPAKNLKQEEPNNQPKQDHSQNAEYSSNNPITDTKFGTNNNASNKGGNEEEEEGLSFLDEEGDSLFSSGFDDSFEIDQKPVQNAQPSKFRFR